ncbi:MAG TPA: PDZ domain-containing protein, partial [Pontibacter sp.]
MKTGTATATNYIYTFLFLLSFAFTQQAGAQELKRRADLGIRATTLPDSLAKAHQLKNGLLTAGILPDATADAMGLKKGDILLSINKKQLSTPAALNNLNQTIQAGQPLE